MTYELRITDAAARDLEDVFLWIARNDSPSKADYVLEQIGVAVHSISSLPHR
jgi:toxin ParE1/3/4